MDETEQIEVLRDSLVDEIVGAVGLHKTRLNHRLFGAIFHRAAHRLAEIGVPFNRITREDGLPAASKWLLTLFCHTPLCSGIENIPPEGPLLIMSNHPGAYDALVLFSMLRRNDIQWVSSMIPFLELLPDVSQHILFATRTDTSQGMVVLRNIVHQLKKGGVVVYFGAGHRDADPAVYPGAEAAIDNWLPVIDPFYKYVSDLRIQPVMMSGMVSERWAYHPITRIRRKAIDKHRLAEFGQVITQLLNPGKYYVTPAISFGKSFSAAELRECYPNGTFQDAIGKEAKNLLKQHVMEFSRAFK